MNTKSPDEQGYRRSGRRTNAGHRADHAEQREKGAAKLSKAAAALLDYACGVPHSEQNLPVLVAPQLEQVH